MQKLRQLLISEVTLYPRWCVSFGRGLVTTDLVAMDIDVQLVFLEVRIQSNEPNY